MKRVAPLLMVCLLVGCGGTSRVGVPVSTGPGAGFLTRRPALARVFRAEYAITPILTAGDTLFSSESGQSPFIFAGRAGGLGLRGGGSGTAALFVSHDDAYLEGYEAGMVTRLVLDLRNGGVYSGDYALRPAEGYRGLEHCRMADSRGGFLHPTFLISERAHTTRPPVVAAVETSGGITRALPWLGVMKHRSTIAIPITSGRVALILTGGSTQVSAGRDQLYLYLANSDSDALAGNGTLYVFRADAGALRTTSRIAAGLRKGFTATGTFVPVAPGVAQDALALEGAVQQAGCLNFARLEDLAIDRERLDGFYVTDRLGYSTGGAVGTGGGRLYRVALDAFDPTRVRELEVVLDASEGDDLYHPSSIDTDDRCVMIQEDPGARGLHPARILRYDVRTRRLEAVAECVERDSRGRALSEGVGGEWETSGILNASELLGDDVWLFTVQAHTLQAPQMSGRWGEAGQLLLLRGPRAAQPRR